MRMNVFTPESALSVDGTNIYTYRSELILHIQSGHCRGTVIAWADWWCWTGWRPLSGHGFKDGPISSIELEARRKIEESGNGSEKPLHHSELAFYCACASCQSIIERNSERHVSHSLKCAGRCKLRNRLKCMIICVDESTEKSEYF